MYNIYIIDILIVLNYCCGNWSLNLLYSAITSDLYGLSNLNDLEP